jgi:hypothetical protein
MENTIPQQSTFRRLLLLLAITLYSALHPFAQTVTIDNVVYSISDSVATVTGLENKSLTTELIIPDSIEYNDTTYPVTSINKNAFELCYGLTSVTIGNSVTSIGYSAFYYCEGLTSVTIGNSVTSIGSCAFADCTGLINVTLGNSLNSIGSQAFSRCAALTSVSIPDSVISIGGFAFENCTGLASIAIPNSVTQIGLNPFSHCSSIQKFIVNADNEHYATDDSGALYNKDFSELLICPGGKTEFDIPQTVTSIGRYAFSCYNLYSITVPNSITSIGDDAFWGCTSLNSIVIPNTVTSIGSRAFQYCSSLTSVLIPNSVTSIGGYAFFGCTSLTEMTIPNTVTSIGKEAFFDCESLTEMTISNSVTSIGDYAFCRCLSVPQFVVEPDNAYYASDEFGAMYNKDFSILLICPCSKTEFDVPNSVTSIANRAFEYCKGLTSVNIGNSVTSIGYSAFDYCKGLTSIVIPNSVISIGSWAFRDCSGLESVTIGSSVSDIYCEAFYGCNKIKKISSYNTTPPLCDGNVFSSYIFKNATVYVPEESIDAYKNAKVWEKFANIEPLSDYDAVPDVITSTDDTPVTVENGAISVMGSDLVQIVTLSGTTIYCGLGEARIEVIPGIYIVKVGAKVTKLAVK